MRELGGSHGHLEEDEKRQSVANGDRTWMQTTPTRDAGENGYGAENYAFETEYSPYSCRIKEEARECATGSPCSHRRVRSASGGLRDFLFVDGIMMSEDEYAQVYAKPSPKAKKSVRRQYDHLRQHSLDAHSDPGYGDTHEPPYLAVKTHSIIDRVSSWLQEIGSGEGSRTSQNLQHAYGQPSKRLTPRRPCSRNHGAAVCSSPRSNPNSIPYNHHETYTNGVTRHDPSVDQRSSDIASVSTNNQPEFKTLSPGSIYRGPGDQRPLSIKAFDFVKKGAEGIVSVSRTAAVEIAKASRTTSMELKDIFQAIIDGGGDQQTDPSEQGSERERVQREPPNPAELERMAAPYVQRVGSGRVTEQ